MHAFISIASRSQDLLEKSLLLIENMTMIDDAGKWRRKNKEVSKLK
jgi:hypothetical protein